MTYFKAKMHQNRFRLGLRPRPHWGAYTDPPDPLAGFGGLLLRRGKGQGGEGGEGKGGEARGGERKGHEPPPTSWRKFTPMVLLLGATENFRKMPHQW